MLNVKLFAFERCRDSINLGCFDACIVNLDNIPRKGLVITELTFACSKSTIETLEKGVKYVQS